MTRFGYSPEGAEKVRTRLDRNLSLIEFHLDRIRTAVPHAGAAVARLDEIQDTAREVVSDLHEVIGERTEVAA